MLRFLLLFLFCFSLAFCITNNADLKWYNSNDQPQNYKARQPYPEGLVETRKIVVNQKLPLLWEVKFTLFNNLETLMIDNCGVKQIKPHAFKDLKPLVDLSLTFNEIRDIKNGVFNFLDVTNLNLSHNKISAIGGEAFDNMSALEKIILDFNELGHWNGEWFFNCTSLKTVSITHNFLDHLPAHAFINFESNDDINFYFSYNKIDRIDSQAFENSGSFGNLFLDWNDLERVDGYVFGKMSGVEYLNLEGDSLRCLSEKFINGVLNMTDAVSIKGNPLKCECLKELIRSEASVRARIEYNKESTLDC